MVHQTFFLEILNQNFTPKLVIFFFQLIKNYAETILLIDKKYITQETPYTAHENSRIIKFTKV